MIYIYSYLIVTHYSNSLRYLTENKITDRNKQIHYPITHYVSLKIKFDHEKAVVDILNIKPRCN